MQEQLQQQTDLESVSRSFVSQFRGSKNRHEDASIENANCGPACLAIMANLFGLDVVDPINANEKIEEFRILANGNSCEYTPTSLDGLNSALTKMGLETWYFDKTATVSDVQRQLEKGRKIILHVNGDHFVVASGIDACGTISIADPSQQGPSIIRLADLGTLMQDKSMIAVSARIGFWKSIFILFAIATGLSLLVRVLIGIL